MFNVVFIVFVVFVTLVTFVASVLLVQLVPSVCVEREGVALREIVWLVSFVVASLSAPVVSLL